MQPRLNGISKGTINLHMGAINYLISKLLSRRCGACGWRQLVPRAKRHADVVCERCLKSRISPFAGKCSVAVRSVGMQRGLFLAIAVNFVYDY